MPGLQFQLFVYICTKATFFNHLIMKYKSLFALAAASLTMLFACQKPVDLGPEKVSIDSEATHEFPVEGGEYTVQLTATVDWTLQGYDETVQSWLSVTPSSGKASAEVQTITIKAMANDGANRQASLVFYGNIMQKAPLTITQKGPDGEGAVITIAEFIEKADTQNEYVLSGVIGDIATNAKYWGFTLKDDTGTISCPFIGATADEFLAMNMHTGDKVSIKGKYEFYADKQQHQLSDGVIVSHEPVSLDAIQTVSVADFISAADLFTMYRLTGEVSSSVNAQYCSFDLKDESGTIVVWTVNNASEYASTLKQGDKVTLRGAYTLYDNGSSTKHEVVDATIESVEAGQGGGETPGPVPGDNIYSNTFENEPSDFTVNDVSLPSGVSYIWTHDSYGYMKASAYVSGTNYASESWLISPVVDLSSETEAYLNFEHANNYFSSTEVLSEQASVWAREENGEWAKLDGISYSGNNGWTFVNSGYINLSAYVGKKMQFAFVYKSTAEKAGTWEVKNVVIARTAPSTTGPEVPDNAIVIELNSSLDWTTATHETYGAGYETTVDGIQIAYYKYGNNNDARQPDSDHIRVYKGSAFSLKSDKTITKVIMYCTDGEYCAALSPLVGEGTYEVNSASNTIEWTGSASEIIAETAAQVRLSKIAVVCE